MHPDPKVIHVPPPLEADFQRMFMELYRDLRGAFPHPFDWLEVLECPPWWRFRARAAHRKVAEIFATHGLLLTPFQAAEFLRGTAPQQVDEDAGGSIIRRLRQVFQWQTGVPYGALVCIEGGRRHGR